jgi:NADH-quinone oxidoreductase subunit M
MNRFISPMLWLEITIAIAALGGVLVSRVRDPNRAWRWGLLLTGSAFLCALVFFVTFVTDRSLLGEESWSLQRHYFDVSLLRFDELSAPLIPLIALLHFLTALATGRTKMRRFSLSWSLTSEAIVLATFACMDPWMLIGLLAAGTLPALVELTNRNRSTRVYVIHMSIFVSLMVVGWIGLGMRDGTQASPVWATVALLVATLIRCGVVPLHCWLTDWFENASFGNALLLVTPLTGVYAAVRLVLPTAPDWVLQVIGAISLITAAYSAGMAVVQKEARRFYAYLFLSNVSLVLVGLELHTTISLTGALALWISASLSLTGLGLTLRALEGRFGRLSLTGFHGLYEHSPALAVCFILTGLANVGFPGTLGFVATELLVDGAVQANLVVGLVIAAIGALNGIGIVRVYFLLFTGSRHRSTVSLAVTPRERVAVLTLTALILGGGLFPQPLIESRRRAAVQLLEQRPLDGVQTAESRLHSDLSPIARKSSHD